MTNIDCRHLLAHHHIPFRTHKENIERFMSSHLGVMAAIASLFPAGF
jgi:hypothetical protein